MSTTMKLTLPIWISRATLAVLLLLRPWEAPPVFGDDGEVHPGRIEGDASASAAAQRSRGGMAVPARLQAHDAQARSLIVRSGAVTAESVLQIDELDVIVQLKGTPAIQMRGEGALAVESALQAGRRAVEETALEVARLENRSRDRRGLAGRGPAEVVTRSYSLVFQGFRARVRRETLPLIERLTSVEKVWPDREVRALLNDSVPLIQASRVWYELGADGTGVRVAIVDTGIDYSHPDLGGCLGPGCKVLGGYDFVNGDSDPMDDFGHGTHVAGIVAANGAVRGVAPGCKLLGYKALNEWGWGSSSDIIAAIERATDPDGNPATDDGAHIINLSLGGLGDPNDPLCQAVDNAVAGGVVVVVAAGNSGPDYETVGSPGVARRALTVGATDKLDTMADFSSRGPASITFQIKPDIVAPGVGVRSTVPRGSCYLCDASGYLSRSGTSMATPHAAGAAALLLDLNPGWTPAQVRAALLQSSLTMGQDVFTRGSGRLDAHAAATSSALAVPPNSSLGLNDPGKASFSRFARITLKNITLAKQTYTLYVQGSFPPGVSASVSPSSMSIPSGRSKSFTLSVTVNNALTPNAPDPSFSYEGVVRVASVWQTLRLPFAFLKTPLLTINFDQAPWFVQVRDEASFYRYRVELTRFRGQVSAFAQAGVS